ncbi:MAG TPA: DUF222 domain-containing protein [Acidimicrobiia bacterium]|nr:DUF222 domain-containing protein [Acidimicrobiia bacterium]
MDFAASRDYPALDAAIRHYHLRADALDDRDPADRNGAHISHLGSRWIVGADLDELAGTTVDEAIRAATDRPSDDDHRTTTKRGADAIETVCRFFLDRAENPIEGGERPHVAIVHGACGPLVARPLPQATIDRLLCDAQVSPIVLDPDGVPLAVGRTRYTPNRAQRRAVMTRDGRCRFPGCNRRPSWCEVHHVRAWAKNGPTDLANLACLCAFHHHLVHQPGWRATFDGITFTVTRPDGTVVARTVNQGASQRASRGDGHQRVRVGAAPEVAEVDVGDHAERS